MKKLIFVLLAFASLPVNAEFVDSDAKEQAEKIASINARIQKIQVLVGQVFYGYFPRESCQAEVYGIKDKPTFLDTQIYTSDTPKQVLIEGIVIDKLVSNDTGLSSLYYYRLKLNDGTIGYTAAESFKDQIADPDSSYSLKTSCWSQLNPQELQSRLDKFESDRKAIEEAKAEKQKQEMYEKQKQAEAAIQAGLAEQQERNRNAPTILREMTKGDFCDAYGKAVRGEGIQEIGDVPDILKLIKPEARRRKLVFNDAKIKSERIGIGISECQLYASWGVGQQNRTVGSWGVHIQHVYGNSYVYTENGRVTSWQD